jgi:hypothetical protein
MSKVLFASRDRDAAHQRLEQEIPAHPEACCTEHDDWVLVWDSQPQSHEEVVRAEEAATKSER